MIKAPAPPECTIYIWKALAARDPERARIRMANHLIGVEESLTRLPDDDPPIPAKD
jgi:hypothetical protein